MAEKWMKAHNLCYTRFMCEHPDKTATLCRVEAGRGDYPLLVCPTCNSCRHMLEPLLASGGGRIGIIPSLRLLKVYAAGGTTRKEIAKKLKLNKNTVGDAFVRFDRIMATESWYHSFTIHQLALELEAKEIQTQHQGDETAYSGSKYGRGKPTCIGATQWYQTIVLLYNTGKRSKKTGDEVFKVADFAIIPVADRKAHTLLTNIAKCVPVGRKIVTDCWRAYHGLGQKYEYQCVNHKKHFKDPVTKAHTNHVESLHRHLKAELTGSLGKDSQSRVIRVMASAALYRGRKLINQSSPFLSALQALQYVCGNGLGMWTPKTFGDEKPSFPNLRGRDDEEEDEEATEIVIKDKKPKTDKGKKPSKVVKPKATAEATAVVVALPKGGGTPKRARGRPPTITIPTTAAEWDKVPADKMDETYEFAKRVSEGLSYGTIVQLSTNKDLPPRHRTETAGGPPRLDDTARELFGGFADQTQPQATPITQATQTQVTQTQGPHGPAPRLFSPGPKTASQLFALGRTSITDFDSVEERYGPDALKN